MNINEYKYEYKLCKYEMNLTFNKINVLKQKTLK